MSNGTDANIKNVSSISAGGESVSIDTNAAKADDRQEKNDDLTNQANGRVRPYFVGMRLGRQPGW